MAYRLSPVANMAQFFDNQDKPLSGGKLFTYAGGSSSIQVTTWRYNDHSIWSTSIV